MVLLMAVKKEKRVLPMVVTKEERKVAAMV